MERYVLNKPSAILVSQLITQSSGITVHGIPFPKVEKILVDIFLDKEKYYFFQGDELVHFFEDAFSSFWISEKNTIPLYRSAQGKHETPAIFQRANPNRANPEHHKLNKGSRQE